MIILTGTIVTLKVLIGKKFPITFQAKWLLFGTNDHFWEASVNYDKSSKTSRRAAMPVFWKRLLHPFSHFPILPFVPAVPLFPPSDPSLPDNPKWVCLTGDRLHKKELHKQISALVWVWGILCLNIPRYILSYHRPVCSPSTSGSTGSSWSWFPAWCLGLSLPCLSTRCTRSPQT